MEQIRLFLLALQFFTRIPVRGRLAGWVGYSPERLSRSTRYFPLVGALMAVLMGIVYAMFAVVLPQSLAVVLMLAAGVALTGAFHEDGWIDFWDAFGGHHDRDKTLSILQDSRIGSYGAIAIVLIMVLKIEALAALDPSWVGVSLLAAQVGSRGCAVIVMRTLPYARPLDDSKAKPIAVNLGRFDTALALLLSLLGIALAAWLSSSTKPFIAGALLALCGTAFLRRLMQRRLGGYTGDGLGAVQQIAEVLFYLGILMVLGAEHVEVAIDPAS